MREFVLCAVEKKELEKRVDNLPHPFFGVPIAFAGEEVRNKNQCSAPLEQAAGSSGQPMQPNDSFQAPAKSSTGWLMVCKSMLDRCKQIRGPRNYNDSDICHKQNNRAKFRRVRYLFYMTIFLFVAQFFFIELFAKIMLMVLGCLAVVVLISTIAVELMFESLGLGIESLETSRIFRIRRDRSPVVV